MEKTANEIEVTDTSLMWEDQKQLSEIKAIYGKDLTPSEFNIFIGIGKATRLNPFLREIWAVKYGSAPASIFIGRDGYRKSAQKDPEYDYHLSDAVYTNDTFTVENGEVKHTYNVKDRGTIAGAYAITKRKNAERPMFCYVEFSEYYAGNKDKTGKTKTNKYGEMKPTLWDLKPATMIKKVAEAQALRMAFQGLFAGTYDESEQWAQKEKTSRRVDAKAKEIVDGPITNGTLVEIRNLVEVQHITEETLKAGLVKMVEKDTIEALTESEGAKVVRMLKAKLEHDRKTEKTTVNVVEPGQTGQEAKAINKSKYMRQALACPTQTEAEEIMREMTERNESEAVMKTVRTALNNIGFKV